MSLTSAAVFALLATQSLGMSVTPSKPIAPHIDAIELFSKVATSDPVYAQECWEKQAVTGFSLAQQAQQAKETQEKPGAGVVGMEPAAFKTYVEVLNDGFMEADCVKDYMYEHGDKFGNNKFKYELGDGARVSIVHYNLHVAKPDRKPMTKDVCFKFCRTVPDMAFFGVTRGRTCYCTPYYKPMSGASGRCTVPCEGGGGSCGGPDKSTIWAMHMCNDTPKQLTKATDKAEPVNAAFTAKALFTKQLAVAMDIAANVVQVSFGTVGDTSATNLAQAAKVFGGDLLHKSEDALLSIAVGDPLVTLARNTTLPELAAGNSSVAEAEDLIDKLDAYADKAKKGVDDLSVLNAQATHEEVLKSAMGYRGVMYFVQRLYASASTTCSGTALAKPIVGGTEDTCATACDSHIAPVKCVGYQFFQSLTPGQNLCFLFSKLKTATYYQGCGLPASASFLQADQGAPPYLSKCMAKLTVFQGTTLAVDKSGKCKQCLKKVTEANRCYAAPPPRRLISVGDKIVAKFPPYRGKSDDAWFAGTVTSISSTTCSIAYEDGDSSSDVRVNEVLYAPSRAALWGKGALRGNNLKPDGAEQVRFQ